MIAYILYQLHHAFLRIHTLTCVYISVCVHIDGLARNRGRSSANTLELPRSCVWPWMFSVYDLVCGCVCVSIYCVCMLYLSYSRTIAHRANVICCTCTRL